MTTDVPEPAAEPRLKWPARPRTLFAASQLRVALASIAGTMPPVFEVWPLLGRLSSPPGPAAITAAGAITVMPAIRPAASQPLRWRNVACVMSWSPSAVAVVSRCRIAGLNGDGHIVRRGSWDGQYRGPHPTRS